MIINHDRKFIFVGLPFSACSAISKELLEHYGCDPLLHKHASIPVLQLARPDIKIKEFEVVAVVRDPVETSLTLYYWLKNNRNEHFTRSENFVENGGAVTKRHRKLFLVVQKNHMTFEQYLDYCFKFIPYDGLLSENAKFLTKVIRYEELQNDFSQCFSELGLKVDRKIPEYNKTEKKHDSYKLNQEKINKYFGPFILYNKRHFLHAACYKKIDAISVGWFDLLKFRFFRSLKSLYRLRLDLKLMSKNISHID